MHHCEIQHLYYRPLMISLSDCFQVTMPAGGHGAKLRWMISSCSSIKLLIMDTF